MKKVHFYLGIGYPSATHEVIIEVDDDCTDDEIQEMYDEWAETYLEKEWWIIAN